MNHSFKSHVFAPQGICKLREVLPPRPHSASSSPTQQSGEPSKEFNPEKAKEPMPRTLRARVLSVFSRPKRLGGGGRRTPEWHCTNRRRPSTRGAGSAPELAPACRFHPLGYLVWRGGRPFPGVPTARKWGRIPTYR